MAFPLLMLGPHNDPGTPCTHGTRAVGDDGIEPLAHNEEWGYNPPQIQFALLAPPI